MKNRITPLIILILFLVLFSIIISLAVYAIRTDNIIKNQQTTINNYKNLESLMITGNRDLVKSLTDFFDSNVTMIDGKNVGPVDFMKYHKQILDSLSLYKDYYIFCQTKYGINLKKVKINDSTTRVISDPPTRADTASLLVPYFSHLVYKKNNRWYTNITDYKGLLLDANKNLDEQNSQRLEESKKAIKGLELALKTIEEYKIENGKLKKNINKLQSILDKLKDKGHLKIDTTKAGEIIFEY